MKTRSDLKLFLEAVKAQNDALHNRVYDKITIDSKNEDAILTLHIKESQFSLNELNELQECWYLFVENKLPEFLPVPMLVTCKTP